MVEDIASMVGRILQCRAAARALAEEGHLDLSEELDTEADKLTLKLTHLRRTQLKESRYDRINATGMGGGE